VRKLPRAIRKGDQRMSNLIRFEVKLPPERHDALESMAKELGLSAPALARLGIGWVLARREALLRGELPLAAA
jgi:hypothetical protein